MLMILLRNVVVTLICILLYIRLTNAANNQYYMEILDSSVEIGKYIHKWCGQKEIGTFELDTINYKVIKSILLPDSSTKVLSYFHSLYGGTPIYHNHSIYKLNRIKGVETIISILWHPTKLTYIGAWKNSIAQGKSISKLFQYLLKDRPHISVLCHSMGHRIFEGIMSKVKDTDNLHLENVLFASADLDIQVFDENLQYLPDIADTIVLYVNENDHFLQLSSMRLNKDRLGLDALDHKKKLLQIKNLQIVDLTYSDYDNILSLSQHIYFKNNKAVFHDIKCILNDNPISRKKYIAYRNKQLIVLK